MKTILDETNAFIAVVPENIFGLSAVDARVVSQEFEFHSVHALKDLREIDFQNKVIDFVKKHPQIDFVYQFKLPKTTNKNPQSFQGHECLSKLPDDTGKGVYMAGSSALHRLMCYFKGDSKVPWKSSDVDLFFVGCPKSTRMIFAPSGADFIFCKEKTIEEVLLNFDLPCCRVGLDFKYNFYVSIQALCAIFTGKMYLPHYLSDSLKFHEKLDEYRRIDPDWGTKSLNVMITKRFYERIQKYQSRGFKTIYTHLDYLLPWLVNRFTYIDFTQLVDKTDEIKKQNSKIVNRFVSQFFEIPAVKKDKGLTLNSIGTNLYLESGNDFLVSWDGKSETPKHVLGVKDGALVIPLNEEQQKIAGDLFL